MTVMRMKRACMAGALLAAFLAVILLHSPSAAAIPLETGAEPLRIEIVNYGLEVNKGAVYKLFDYREYSAVENMRFCCDSDLSTVDNAWIKSQHCAEGVLSVGDWEDHATLKVTDRKTSTMATLALTLAGNTEEHLEPQEAMRC